MLTEPSSPACRLSLVSATGAQRCRQHPASTQESSSFERRGIPTRFGSPRPGSCCGGGWRDDAPAHSRVSLRLDECGAPVYSGFSAGKGLQPISVGAAEAALLLELRCCCLRASLCHFVTGFGGAGGKATGLPSPCDAQAMSFATQHTAGAMQGQGGLLGERLLLGRWGKEGWG